MSSIEYTDIVIPTYVIGLKSGEDRSKHIKKQFDGRMEFEVNIVKAIKEINTPVDLWLSIVNVINLAIANQDDVIIICQDDHEFTVDYSRDYLFQHIIEAHSQGTHLLIGGLTDFDQIVPLTEHRYWINTFVSTQFMVVYRNFFQQILEEIFTEEDTVSDKLSEMTSNKMVLHPFVSIQNDPGTFSMHSDPYPINNGSGNALFKAASERITKLDEIYAKYT